MNSRALPALLFATAAFAARFQPPPTPAHPVTDTYHGVTVTDPYRWLENWDDPAVKAWSAAQNTAARAVLDSLPHVDAIRERVTAILSAQTTSYSSLKAAGGKLFALKRQPPKQQPFIVVMDSPRHPELERVLVDPNAMSAKGSVEIDWFEPSPDGRLVAVSLSEGGSEAGDLHIFNVATGERVFETIPGVQNGTGGGSVAWLPDSKSFFYTRYPRGDERPPEDHGFYMQLWRHTLGNLTDGDHYEIGRDFPKIAEVTVETSSDGVALVCMQKGDGGEFQHYVRTLDGKWTQLTHYDDRVVQAALGRSAGGRRTGVYLVSLKDAPRGQLLRITLDSHTGAGASLAEATTVLPEMDDTLISGFGEYGGNLAITDHYIYATYQLGGPSELRTFNLDGSPARNPAQFPVGAVGGLAPADDHGDALLFRDTSYVEPSTWFHFDPAGGPAAKTPLSASAPVDFADCEVVREFATSQDGTKIPVNIIRRKGLALDGSHPCLVTGYGGYGVNINPAFRTALRVLVDQGFVWAQANLRGGGEFGDAWHRAGNLTHKQNVFDDFYAACRHLIDAGYTNPKKLAIEGGSNGGLLMGATLTQHPDTFACVISHVGIYDMLRVELSTNGAFNIPEFGTVKDEAQFRALYAYSPYHHVREGVHYPPVLLLTGANDPRVDPMQSRKMTARLQAAGDECLLRTSANSGHGMGSSLSERIEQAVDVDAFLFAQLGLEYRPPPTNN
ncbi:MAG TPA: prolyl oligopeptidase family serine peptidase [Opitutus sp.]|nr:prolyl oligopeptidase family serine peptidase [Opitutus sp.]